MRTAFLPSLGVTVSTPIARSGNLFPLIVVIVVLIPCATVLGADRGFEFLN